MGAQPRGSFRLNLPRLVRFARLLNTVFYNRLITPHDVNNSRSNKPVIRFYKFCYEKQGFDWTMWRQEKISELTTNLQSNC